MGHSNAQCPISNIQRTSCCSNALALQFCIIPSKYSKSISSPRESLPEHSALLSKQTITMCDKLPATNSQLLDRCTHGKSKLSFAKDYTKWKMSERLYSKLFPSSCDKYANLYRPFSSLIAKWYNYMLVILAYTMNVCDCSRYSFSTFVREILPKNCKWNGDYCANTRRINPGWPMEGSISCGMYMHLHHNARLHQGLVRQCWDDLLSIVFDVQMGIIIQCYTSYNKILYQMIQSRNIFLIVYIEKIYQMDDYLVWVPNDGFKASGIWNLSLFNCEKNSIVKWGSVRINIKKLFLLTMKETYRIPTLYTVGQVIGVLFSLEKDTSFTDCQMNLLAVIVFKTYDPIYGSGPNGFR